MNALLRLVRFSLAPTLLGDLAAGLALIVGSAALPFGSLFAVLPGSLLLFLAGMAWNAWVDRVQDAVTRPDRPLPMAQVPAWLAAAIAGAGFVLAPAMGFWLGGAHRQDLCLWFASMGLLIAAYHTPVRRSALLGPVTLGAIRMANLLAGAVILVGLGPELGEVIAPAALYGAYVAGASMVAHQEDRLVRPGWLLAGAWTCLLAVALTLVVAIVATGASVALQVATVAVAAWHVGPLIVAPKKLLGVRSPAQVEALARVLLGRMPLLTAALSFASGNAMAGVLALTAFQLVRLMVRSIPPT